MARILIVDDELASGQVLAEGLELGGFSCDLARGAAEALEKIRPGTFDLVLSDIEMPGRNGVELLKILKAREPDLDVVMVTGVVDIRTALQSIRLGASDYITKPFNHEEVRIIVERTLEKRRLIRENRAYQQDLEQRVTERTRELSAAYGRIERTYQQTLEALMQALDMRDAETQGHSLRVVEYTLEIARRMGVREPELTDIRRGALLHDIGKIGIPDAILRKPARLDPEEWKIMKEHPELGYQMLEGIEFLDNARQIVLCHQERYDGTGYPARLKGEGIPLGARVFAVADTLDAMTSTRPYRNGLGYAAVRAEMLACSGTQFDPKVVEVFLAIPPARWDEIQAEVHQRMREAASKAAALRTVMG